MSGKTETLSEDLYMVQVKPELSRPDHVTVDFRVPSEDFDGISKRLVEAGLSEIDSWYVGESKSQRAGWYYGDLDRLPELARIPEFAEAVAKFDASALVAQVSARRAKTLGATKRRVGA